MRLCERSTGVTTDPHYEVRREALIPVALYNLQVRLKTTLIKHSLLLDEVDRLYDEMYRPEQAEVRGLIKEHIRYLAEQRQMPRRMSLIRSLIH
jgi:hypothetical protein